jgi:hypothetical protein
LTRSSPWLRPRASLFQRQRQPNAQVLVGIDVSASPEKPLIARRGGCASESNRNPDYRPARKTPLSSAYARHSPRHGSGSGDGEKYPKIPAIVPFLSVRIRASFTPCARPWRPLPRMGENEKARLGVGGLSGGRVSADSLLRNAAGSGGSGFPATRGGSFPGEMPGPPVGERAQTANGGETWAVLSKTTTL